MELAGIDDPARAKAIVQRSAFLEFRITDKTGALEKSIPAMDRVLRRLGVAGRTPPPASRPRWSSSSVGTRRPRQPRPTAPRGTRARWRPAGSSPRSSSRRGRRHAPRPGEYMVPETAFPRVDSLINLPEVARQLPRGIVLRWNAQPDQRRGPVRIASSTRSTRSRSSPAATSRTPAAQIDPLTNGPIVTFQLDRAGGRKFGDETGTPRRRLHGDPPRRPGAGPAARSSRAGSAGTGRSPWATRRCRRPRTWRSR